MKVPHDEGLAAHIGPESCVYARKGISEALTGGMRAGLLSCESFKIQRSQERKATPAVSLWRDAAGPCVVREPVHVYKFFVREPGGPTFGLW
jgi:hypothetical protein